MKPNTATPLSIDPRTLMLAPASAIGSARRMSLAPSNSHVLSARIFYVAALMLPFAAIALLERATIADWLVTGMCPGGPMDRSAHLCGFGELFSIVFLGGWVAFLVIPVLVVWFVLCTAAFLCTVAFFSWRRRRAQR